MTLCTQKKDGKELEEQRNLQTITETYEASIMQFRTSIREVHQSEKGTVVDVGLLEEQKQNINQLENFIFLKRITQERTNLKEGTSNPHVTASATT